MRNSKLFFDGINQIVYEIIINIFTLSFMAASLTHLCPYNYLLSNYQTHHLHKFQITVKHVCKKRIVCKYREKKIKKSINELVYATD